MSVKSFLAGVVVGGLAVKAFGKKCVDCERKARNWFTGNIVHKELYFPKFKKPKFRGLG